MKGILFTEFLELTEEKYGLEIVQRIIDECDLKSDGIYTAIGTYSHKEFFIIINKIAEINQQGINSILEEYGNHFLWVLSKSYPVFFKKENTFEFLKSIDNYIHPTVLKLYPKAELPRFESIQSGRNELKLTYYSSRKMVYFAIGLIKASGTFFKEEIKVDIEKELLDGEEVVIKISYEK